MSKETSVSCSPPGEGLFTAGRLACVISLLLLMLYPEVILGSHSFFYRDFGLFGYPLAHYHRERFWDGEIPLWNPLNNCGLPFLAQWNTMVLYPFSLIYLLLPLPWSLNLFVLLHVVIAGVGMHKLAEHWTGNRFAASVAGLAFAWNGLTLHALMWPNNIAALAWMPWVVWLAERARERTWRAVCPAALAGAAQMLTGAPEVILFTWLIVLIMACAAWVRREGSRRQVVLRTGALIGLVFCLSAAQLLPFLDLLAHSHRDAKFGTEDWAMPPWGWANFFVPLFRMTPSVTGVFSQDEQQWTSSYYMAIGVTALALIAVWRVRTLRVRVLAAVAVAGLFLALGSAGGLYNWFRQAAPPVGLARFPIKFIVLTIFAIPLLAGCAVEWLQRAGWRHARRDLVKVAVAIACLIALVLWVAWRWPFPGDPWSVVWKNAISRVGILVGVFVLAVFYLRGGNAWWRGVAGFGVLLTLGIDGATHAPRQNPTVQTQALRPIGLQEKLSVSWGRSRVMVSPAMQGFLDYAATADSFEYCTGVRLASFMNCNLIEGMPQVGGFYSLYVREEKEVSSLAAQDVITGSGHLPDFLGVSRISSDKALFGWNEREFWMPLISAGQLPVFENRDGTLQALLRTEFNPRREVYLPANASEVVSAREPSKVEILEQHYEAEQIDLLVRAERPALVVIAQTYYHPWRAYVDGFPTTLWRANHAYQAVEVGAGERRVKLVYHDGGFYLGGVLSGMTLAGLVAVWLWAKRRGCSGD